MKTLHDIDIVEVPKKKINHIPNKRKWLDIQRKFLRHNKKCAVCGTENHIEIHHIIPVNIAPHLMFEESNLISLCRKGKNCHLIHGHLGNFNNFNPNILQLKKF